MSISEIIRKLMQFDKTERITIVKMYVRNSDGDVLESKTFPVEAVFSHNEDAAEIIIEQSQCFGTLNPMR